MGINRICPHGISYSLPFPQEDLYFTSSARQVWKNSKDETLGTTVQNFVSTRFNKNEERIKDYFYEWINTGPMFGRETSDHYVDLGNQKLGHGLESFEGMAEKAKRRLAKLNAIPLVAENEYLKYQNATEELYISFFENQELFVEAYNLAGENKNRINRNDLKEK